MSGYLKLPPYGRALLDARDLGHHPKLICVWYGDRWWERPRETPCVCVGPDYTHGVYDWGAVVAGVPVDLWWRGGRRIRRLVAELAEHSPIVTIVTARGRFLADTFLSLYPQRRRHPLWPRDAEDDYLARQREFYAAVLEDLTSEAAHVG